VGADLVAALAVEPEALPRARAVALIEADDLDQALEAAEERRPLGTQVEQHLIVQQLLAHAVDDNGRFRGERVVGCAMRHEPDRGRHPQRAVKALGGLAVGAEDGDPEPVRERLARELARGLELVLGVRVEVNLRHVTFSRPG
jgi:hypothetical protein